MAFDLKKLMKAVDHSSADWVGIRYVRETTGFRFVRDGRPEHNDRSTSEGIMVEVLADGQFAYAATPRLDEAGVREAAARALKQAKAAAPHAVHKFTQDQRPPSKGEYRSPFQKSFNTLGAKEINDRLVKISETLRVSSKIIRTTALARTVETDFQFVSSNGADFSQQFTLVTTDFSATASHQGVTQRRSDAGHFARSYQAGFEVFELDDCLKRARITGEQAVELLTAPECPTATTSLILMPDQMMLQIHESIGHPLEIDRILGDERNYAGASFVKLDDFGKLQYGSPLMNVTFDPTVPGEFAGYAFDDSGMPAKREFLVKDGVLLRGLGGLESQARSKVAGTANFRSCSWNRPPIDRMANLNLEPGDATFEQIVSSVEDGVLMESNRSWSIDDYRRKFQFGCEFGQRIKNGRIIGTVRNPNYRGVTVPFWNSLKKVGRTETRQVFGTPHCGKGEPNQAIRVGHASPVCLFENIEVFGGAS